VEDKFLKTLMSRLDKSLELGTPPELPSMCPDELLGAWFRALVESRKVQRH